MEKKHIFFVLHSIGHINFVFMGIVNQQKVFAISHAYIMQTIVEKDKQQPIHTVYRKLFHVSM